MPLLVTGLPVFLRWRGRPPFGEPTAEQLVDVCDRLIVDSGEWPDVPGAYRELPLRPHGVLRHRLAAHRALAPRAGRPLAGDRQGAAS